jgi:hypothetical protein
VLRQTRNIALKSFQKTPFSLHNFVQQLNEFWQLLHSSKFRVQDVAIDKLLNTILLIGLTWLPLMENLNKNIAKKKQQNK